MKSALLYLVLVGPPLLGLLGILEAGERLDAPRSIGGDWQLDRAFVDRAAASCLRLDFGDELPILRVSQSGTQAEITIRSRPRVMMATSLRGDSLTGEGDGKAASACGERGLAVRAVVQGAAGRERMSGVLTAGDSGVPFVAQRRPAARGGGH